MKKREKKRKKKNRRKKTQSRPPTPSPCPPPPPQRSSVIQHRQRHSRASAPITCQQSFDLTAVPVVEALRPRNPQLPPPQRRHPGHGRSIQTVPAVGSLAVGPARPRLVHLPQAPHQHLARRLPNPLRGPGQPHPQRHQRAEGCRLPPAPARCLAARSHGPGRLCRPKAQGRAQPRVLPQPFQAVEDRHPGCPEQGDAPADLAHRFSGHPHLDQPIRGRAGRQACQRPRSRQRARVFVGDCLVDGCRCSGNVYQFHGFSPSLPLFLSLLSLFLFSPPPVSPPPRGIWDRQ